MKKVLVILVALSWHSGARADTTLPVLAQELDVLITELTALSKDFVNGQLVADPQIILPSPQQPPIVLVKSASELAMDAIVGSLYKDLLDPSSMSSDAFTSDKADDYSAEFSLYEQQEGAVGKQYSYYKFGSLFLPLLVAKNALEKDLMGMDSGDPEDIRYSDVTPFIKKDAQSFLDAYQQFNAFVKKASSASVVALPVGADIYDGYAELVPYANTIVTLKQPTMPVLPPVAKVSAQSFILKNFGDSQLSSLSSGALQSLLTAFAKTYEQSDDFYSEYQMWAVYVPTRYWELQLLAGNSGAAKAFSLKYLNSFKPTYAKNDKLLSEPYKTQLAAMALEFSVVYATARAEMRAIDNKLYE